MDPKAVQRQNPQGNAVAKAETGGIKKWLQGDQFRQAVQAALPRHLTPERFIRVCMTALLKTPKLAECTEASVFECMLTLSSLGLEPDGRRAHLIPFKKSTKTPSGWVTEMRCQLILDYKGIVELVMNSGLVSNIHADVVCENDEFEYNMGEVVKHKIDFRRPRGAAYAVYCRIKFKDGSTAAEAMTMQEVEAVKARSKSANDGPWVTDFREMAKKTVFKRLSKWCIWSTDPAQREKVDVDDDQFKPEPTRPPVSAATIELGQLTASSDPNRGHDNTALPVIEEAQFEDVAQDEAEPEQSQPDEPTQSADEPPRQLQHRDEWPTEDPMPDWCWVGQGIFKLDDDGNYKKHSDRAWPIATIEDKPQTTAKAPVSFRRNK